MGLIAKELGRALINATAEGSADTIVTNLTTLDTIITQITMFNAHTIAVTVTLCRVPDAALSVGTDDAEDVFWKQSIAAGDTEILGSQDAKVPLTDTNDTLQAYASIADKVNIFCDGFTFPDQS